MPKTVAPVATPAEVKPTAEIIALKKEIEEKKEKAAVDDKKAAENTGTPTEDELEKK